MEILLSQEWAKSFLALGDGMFKKLLGKENRNLSKQLHNALTNDIQPTYYGQRQKLNDGKRFHGELDDMSHSDLLDHVKSCEKRIDDLERLFVGEDINWSSHEQQPNSQNVRRRLKSNQ